MACILTCDTEKQMGFLFVSHSRSFCNADYWCSRAYKWVYFSWLVMFRPLFVVNLQYLCSLFRSFFFFPGLFYLLMEVSFSFLLLFTIQEFWLIHWLHLPLENGWTMLVISMLVPFRFWLWIFSSSLAWQPWLVCKLPRYVSNSFSSGWKKCVLFVILLGMGFFSL